MVPFADSLNHRNVQTKYDYNVDGNGLFRMFPSGKNRYPKGTEVFNSYGRRPNLNLMMDFGFGLLYNEWDCVSVYPYAFVYNMLNLYIMCVLGGHSMQLNQHAGCICHGRSQSTTTNEDNVFE